MIGRRRTLWRLPMLVASVAISEELLNIFEPIVRDK